MTKWLALLSALFVSPCIACSEEKKPDAPPVKEKRVERVRQGFPAAGADKENLEKSDSAWDIEWDFAPVGRQSIFRIASAKFMWKDANGKPRWLNVVNNLQFVEAFSQYNDNQTCFLDIAKVGIEQVAGKKEYLGPTCIGAGELLKSKYPSFDEKVHMEMHYDGLRWMKVYNGDAGRRGEKLVLWSAIKSVNYVFIMEYNFTDDGRILCRLGFTAHNYFDREKVQFRKGKFRENNEDIHIHIGCWKLDFDLSDPATGKGGPARNEIKLITRMFEKGKFRQEELPFPGDDKAKESGAREGKARWVAKNFTTLRAESLDVENGNKKKVGYDLITMRVGATEDLFPVRQSQGMNMDFVNYDFWVTRTPQQFKHFYQLPDTAKGEQALTGQATTVWHSVPVLHAPRDEDFGPGGTIAGKGAAMTEWIGFTLRPRNLFDGTPFYAPGKK